MQSLKYLNQLATYLQVQPGKITLNNDQQPTRVVANNVAVTGFVNVISSFLNQTNAIKDYSNEEIADLYQWLEYAIVYAVHNDVSHNVHQILTELNGALSTKTYLVSNHLSIADVLIYYIIQNVMENLQYVEKEKYINLSRWFDNIQQDKKIRQNNRIVDFSTLYLSRFVPARH